MKTIESIEPGDTELPVHARAVEHLLDWSLLQWRTMTNDKAIRLGLEWFRTHRVTSLTLHEDGLSASLSDGAKGEPACEVQVRVDDPERATVDLRFVASDSPQPDEARWGAAIAAVLAYQASQPASDRLIESVADQMREERRRRGQHGVHANPPGKLIWGVWTAESVDRTGPHRPPYRVHLRALDADLNGCTCPDFANNQLGTCKHIEAVRLRAGSAPRSVHPLVVPYLRADGRLVGGVQVPRAHRGWFDDAIAGWPAGERTRVTTGPGGASRVEWPDLALETFLDRIAAWSGRPEVSIGPDLHQRMETVAARRLWERQAQTRREEFASLTTTPEFLSVPLYPYQVEGIQHLAGCGRAVLADDMGLGKTLQAIGAMRALMLRGDVAHTLIVAPTSLMHQWQAEILKFTGLNAEIMQGSAKDRLAQLAQRPTIAITSYDRLVRDFGGIRHDFRPDLVIADEAQRFKNWQTRSAAFIKALDAPFRFALTGTPLENRLLELYSIIEFVDPLLLGAMWRFVQEFHITDSRGEPIRARNLGALRSRIEPVLLRRDRSLVVDQLPERQDIRLLAPLDERQRDLHEGAVATIERLGAIRRKRPLNPAEQRRMQAAITQARMACDCAGLIDKHTATSPKLELFAELIQQLCVEGGQKVVVFSQWILMGELAAEHATRAGTRCLQLHGGLSAERRAEMVTQFAQDPSVGVLICSDAGSTGLNLQMATALIHLDMPWTAAIHEQRSARIYRLGQRNNVLVYTLLAADSYELHVEATVRQKAHLFAATVGEGDTSAYDDTPKDDGNEPTDAALAAATNATVVEEEGPLAPLDFADGEAAGDTDETTPSVYAEDPDDEEPLETTGAEAGAVAATTRGDSRSASATSATRAAAPHTESPGSPTQPPASTGPGRPRTAAEADTQFADLQRVSDVARPGLDALWKFGRRRLALEMLIRGESIKACAVLGDAVPAGWEALAEWWQLRVAAQGFVPIERALSIANASAYLALPNDIFDVVVDDALWQSLVGE